MRSAFATDFESLSTSGFIHVRIVNVGDLQALFTVRCRTQPRGSAVLGSHMFAPRCHSSVPST